jgi:Ku protein
MISRPRLSMPGASTTSPVSARSSWSGQIVVGSVVVPVKAYAAIASPSTSALHMIHRDCGQPITQPRTCPTHGPVTTDDIAKVFRFAPGDDVVLSPTDLDSLKPQGNDQLRIEHLMTSRRFDLSLTSGRTLFIVPAHAATAPEYGVVCSLLAKHDLWGIGRAVLNDRSQLLALHVVQDVLTAFVLHWPQTRRACPVFDRTPGDPQRLRQLEKETLPLRRSFAWGEYQDDYEPRLTELVRAKIAARAGGTATTSPKSRKKPNPTLTARAA